MKTCRSLSLVPLVAGALLTSGCAQLMAEGDVPSADGSRSAPAGRAVPAGSTGARASSRRELPAGTAIQVRLSQDVDSGTAAEGEEVAATVGQPVLVDGAVVIAAGTRVLAKVDEVRSARRFGGQAMVSVRFLSVAAQGEDVEVTGALSSNAKSEKGRDTAIIAGSAAGGAILGKVVGGDDKDAVAGAIVGGGIGTAVASRKGDEALLPAGATATVTTLSEETLFRVD